MNNSNIDKKLFERANPVSKTAITTLIGLAGAGYEEDAEILRRLGLRPEDYLGEHSLDDVSVLCDLVIREMRHVVANRTVLESGCETVVDIPCGYTGRVLDMLRENRRYVGGDLPPVIRRFEPVIRCMIPGDKQKSASFAEVDVTNFETLSAAVRDTSGPVCFITEGLLIYLNKDEKKRFFDNIYRLLSERGGCWINTDIETLAYYKAAALSLAGDKAGAFIRDSLRGFSTQSDTDILGIASSVTDKTLGGGIRDGMDFEAIKRSYEDFGLKAELIPYSRDDLTLRMFGRLTPEQTEKVLEAFRQVNIWKFTADPDLRIEDSADVRELSVTEGNFTINAENRKGRLTIRLRGRLDSLTAPVLLKVWEDEKASGTITSVTADCEELEYISSAGLRVLLIIEKTLPMVVTNVSKEINEIFKTTGFDSVFDIRLGW